MSDESDDKNLGIENKITRRDFMKFLGAAGTLVTLPTLVPLRSAFGGNTTRISSNSNTKTLITSYQASLIFLN
jgi:TAT (twin-arginine translocation) pathway-exported protein